MKRGQSAFEFMILVGFLLFSFVVFLAIVNENMSSKNWEKQNQRLYEVASTVKSEVDLAHGSMDGYSRNFNLPPNLGGQSYQVNLNGGLVGVKTVDGKYSMALPIKNVSGVVILGENKIVRENGFVKINP